MEEGTPLIYFVLTGVATLITAMGIPKILQIVKDDKCSKKIAKIKQAVNGSIAMMDLLMTTIAVEFTDKPGLEQAVTKMQEQIQETLKVLNDDEK